MASNMTGLQLEAGPILRTSHFDTLTKRFQSKREPGCPANCCRNPDCQLLRLPFPVKRTSNTQTKHAVSNASFIVWGPRCAACVTRGCQDPFAASGSMFDWRGMRLTFWGPIGLPRTSSSTPRELQQAPPKETLSRTYTSNQTRACHFATRTKKHDVKIYLYINICINDT